MTVETLPGIAKISLPVADSNVAVETVRPPFLRVDITEWKAEEVTAYLTAATMNGFKFEVWGIEDSTLLTSKVDSGSQHELWVKRERLALTIKGDGNSLGFNKTISDLLGCCPPQGVPDTSNFNDLMRER